MLDMQEKGCVQREAKEGEREREGGKERERERERGLNQ